MYAKKHILKSQQTALELKVQEELQRIRDFMSIPSLSAEMKARMADFIRLDTLLSREVLLLLMNNEVKNSEIS